MEIQSGLIFIRNKYNSIGGVTLSWGYADACISDGEFQPSDDDLSVGSLDIQFRE